jgi:hypothetical protein
MTAEKRSSSSGNGAARSAPLTREPLAVLIGWRHRNSGLPELAR